MTDRRVGSADLNVDVAATPQRRVGTAELNVDVAASPQRRVASFGLNVDVRPVITLNIQTGSNQIMVDTAPTLLANRQTGSVVVMMDGILAAGDVIGAVGVQIDSTAPTTRRAGGVDVQSDVVPVASKQIGSVKVMVDVVDPADAPEPPEPLPPPSAVRHGWYHHLEDHGGLYWDGAHHDFGFPFVDEWGDDPDMSAIPGGIGWISGLLASRTDPDKVFVWDADDSAVYVSLDRGTTWTHRPAPPWTGDGPFDNEIGIGPADELVVAKSWTVFGIYVSTDTGLTWTKVYTSTYTSDSIYIDDTRYQNAHGPTAVAVGDTKMWWTEQTGGEVWHADHPNPGTPWASYRLVQANLDGTGIVEVALTTNLETGPLKVYHDDLVLIPNGYLYKATSGGEFLNITPPDPDMQYVWDAVAVNSSVYLCLVRLGGATTWRDSASNLWRTVDGGATWTNVLHLESWQSPTGLGVDFDLGYPSLSVPPGRSTTEVFLSGGVGGVGKVPDATHPWYPADPDLKYEWAGLVTWYSQDGGATWEMIEDTAIPIYYDGYYYYVGPGGLQAADFLAEPPSAEIMVKWPGELFTLNPSDPQTYWTQVTPMWPNPGMFSLYTGRLVDFHDLFNRADSDTIGNGWTESGGNWTLASNAVHSVSSGSAYLLRPAEVQAGEDIVSYSYIIQTYLTLGAGFWGGSRGIGIVGRYVDESNFYLVWIDGVDNMVKCYRGGYVDLGSWASFTIPTGPFSFSVNFNGQYITAYLDGALLHEWSDTTHSTPGSYGLRTYNADAFTNSVDEFHAVAQPIRPPADPVVWLGDHFDIHTE